MDCFNGVTGRVLLILNVYGVLIGYTSFVRNNKKRSYFTSKLYTFIANSSNVLAIITCIWWYKFYLMDFHSEHVFMMKLVIINSSVTWMAVFYTNLKRPNRDVTMLEIRRALKNIETDYIQQQPVCKNVEKFCQNFLNLKLFLFVGSWSIIIFDIHYCLHLQESILIFATWNFSNVLAFMNMDYMLCILFIMRLRRYLNQHLNRIIHTCEAHNDICMEQLEQDIKNIQAYHMQLNKIIESLLQNFSLQLTTLRVRGIFMTIFISHGLWMMFTIYKPPETFMILVINTYLLSLVNIYLTYMMTDVCERDSQMTMEKLQQLNFHATSILFDRKCEIFSLYESVCPSRFMMFNAIGLNKPAYFLLMDAMIRYYLSLLQFFLSLNIKF